MSNDSIRAQCNKLMSGGRTDSLSLFNNSVFHLFPPIRLPQSGYTGHEASTGKSLTSSFNTWKLSKFQTFLTLSLQDMASRVQLSGPQEAEKYVLHMVRPLTWGSYPIISVWVGSTHPEQLFFRVEEMLTVYCGVETVLKKSKSIVR